MTRFINISFWVAVLLLVLKAIAFNVMFQQRGKVEKLPQTPVQIEQPILDFNPLLSTLQYVATTYRKAEHFSLLNPSTF